MYNYDNPTFSYPKKIKVLSEETLLDVFGDKMCKLDNQKCCSKSFNLSATRLLSPLLKLLNTLLVSEFDRETDEEWDLAKHQASWELDRAICMSGETYKLSRIIPVQETYEGLNKIILTAYYQWKIRMRGIRY